MDDNLNNAQDVSRLNEIEDRRYQLLFRSLEFGADDEYLMTELVPKDYPIDQLAKGKVEYFKNYGFKVSKKHADIYSKYNGIVSEQYMVPSIYHYYIVPYLCNLNLMESYVDKNMYGKLFPDVRQPETVVRCMNQRFYTADYREIHLQEAVERLNSVSRFIIKPSMDSWGGKDVRMIETANVDSPLSEIITNDYSDNWIAQVPVKNHQEMASFNETSLNTMRIYTYRPVGSNEYVVLGATLRFGGKGAIIDNAGAGGFFCGINPDGTVKERFNRFGDLTHYRRSEHGIGVDKLSGYDRAWELCLQLHSRLPYFDLIGWDIAIEETGEPVLVEFNRAPGCGNFQIAHGPMFGEYLDDLMKAVSSHKTVYKVVSERSFDPEKQGFARYQDFQRL